MTFTVSLHSFDPAQRNVKLMELDGVVRKGGGLRVGKGPSSFVHSVESLIPK